MKIYQKIFNFTFVILILFFSYLVCSSHEIPNTTGYITKRKRFCSTPFYIIFVFAFIIYFFII